MIAVLYFRLFTDDIEKDDDDDKEELNEDHELVKLLAYCYICYYNICLITLAHRSRKLQVFNHYLKPLQVHILQSKFCKSY